MILSSFTEGTLKAQIPKTNQQFNSKVDFEVYVMGRDGGSPPTRLTTGGGFTPAWSPDGSRIVFSLGELFTMRAGGSGQKPVRPGVDGHHPDW